MDFLNYFAPDYTFARAKFLEAAEAAHAQIVTYTNPANGPDDCPLCTDVAIVGDDAASTTLLVNTGTHGVEGFAGSAALVGWLRSGLITALPPFLKVVLVHGLNPHAFAWGRRVNEDNVDVNRNFLDHGDAYPTNSQYERLHSMLVPDSLDPETLEKCERALALHTEADGTGQVHAQISRGQFSHPDGLYFGGHQPTWSNRIFCTILAECVAGTEQLAFIDLHTGPGAHGHASLTCADPETPSADARAQRWFGVRPENPAETRAAGGPIAGGIANAVRDIVLGAEVTSVTVKFGTVAHDRIFNALRVDNWMHLLGHQDSAESSNLKAQLLECYCPKSKNWRELVWIRSRQVFIDAVQGLTAPIPDV